MEIVLVRHAQPNWEPDDRAIDNPGLTEFGRRQALATASHLAGTHFDAVYTSPLQRVRETAEPIIEALGLSPHEDSWLREIGLPSLAGQSSAQVQAYFRAANARHLEDWWDGPPGGESFRHFYERITSGMEGLLAGQHRISIHEDAHHRLWHIPEGIERILIIAHEGTNAVLLSHLLGIEPVPWAWIRFSSAWTGISRVESVQTAGGVIWALESFNRIDHLAEIAEPPEADGRAFARNDQAAP